MSNEEKKTSSAVEGKKARDQTKSDAKITRFQR